MKALLALVVLALLATLNVGARAETRGDTECGAYDCDSRTGGEYYSQRHKENMRDLRSGEPKKR